MKKLRIVLAQLNLKVGDIDGNLAKHINAANTARDEHKADVIVFPELSITGYSPQDLLLRPAFLNAAADALTQFKTQVKGIHCLVGHPHHNSHGLFNSCSLIHDGIILGRYDKHYLPNYSVFDECRYFTPNNAPTVIPINGIPVGLLICEDLWYPGPIQQAAAQGARLILAPNASPFELNKHERRLDTLTKRAKSISAPIIYVNCVGGQDELVFDGDSMVVDQTGQLVQHAGFFNEDLLPVDIEISSTDTKVSTAPVTIPSEEQQIYDCLVLGLRDYVHKNGFKSVVVGSSGGIDSALTLAIATDALGKKNVTSVFMPSRFSAPLSQQAAEELAKNLHIQHEVISIEPTFSAFLNSLALSKKEIGITEQNIQSRCRAIILMALSNQFGHLVISTGNHSELAVGYATLYGDMSGAFAILKNIPKTMVYKLAYYRNQLNYVIPTSIIERPPTAELAPNQKDEDSLPPYPVLDEILRLYINSEKSIEDIVSAGFDQKTVKKVVNLLKQTEYKRWQAPVGIHISHKSFGLDWRYPITSGFKG